MVRLRAIANSVNRFPPAEIIFEWRAMHTMGARPRPSSNLWGRAGRSLEDVLLQCVTKNCQKLTIANLKLNIALSLIPNTSCPTVMV